jgi:hypothetical protein
VVGSVQVLRGRNVNPFLRNERDAALSVVPANSDVGLPSNVSGYATHRLRRGSRVGQLRENSSFFWLIRRRQFPGTPPLLNTYFTSWAFYPVEPACLFSRSDILTFSACSLLRRLTISAIIFISG